MSRSHLLAWGAALSVLVAVTPAEGKTDVEQARQLFERYVELWDAFDPAVADLYADEVLIRNTRRAPDGSSNVWEVGADEYRRVLTDNMAYNKRRNDSNTYSDVTYTREGARVRIRATRFSRLKERTFPHELLVGPDHDGRWRIFEEIAESIPRPKDGSCRSEEESDACPAGDEHPAHP